MLYFSGILDRDLSFLVTISISFCWYGQKIPFLIQESWLIDQSRYFVVNSYQMSSWKSNMMVNNIITIQCIPWSMQFWSCFVLLGFCHESLVVWWLDGLVQERCNSSALAMELRLSCTNPSMWSVYPYSSGLALPQGRADFRFAPSQREMALLCNNVSHWLGTNLEPALQVQYDNGWVLNNFDCCSNFT